MTRSISRWWIVVLAALAMGAAGTYQFVWSSIRTAVGVQLGVPETGLGIAFTAFVVAQALVQLPAGRFRDRRGPTIPLFVGGVLITAGYSGVALAGGARGVTLSYALGGLGSGVVYAAAVSTPVKWFDDRRGLATSVVMMSYSGTSGLLIPSVRAGLAGEFRTTLFTLGIGAGVVCIVGAPLVRDPERPADDEAGEDGEDADDASGESTGSPPAYSWRETVRTRQFWVLYAAFVVVNGVGLMVIGKAVGLASALGLPDAAGTGAASAIALAEAGGVVVLGAASDRLGAERTVGATLVVCGVSLAAAVWGGSAGLATVFVAGVTGAAFFRASAFSILPGLVGEYYGTERSAENFAALYTAKIWGGVGGGAVASAAIAFTGWATAFFAGAGLLSVAGLLALTLSPVER